NGRDDDGNGYVDDVYGWNFIGGPDGRHVDEDTYEVTRLVAACRDGADRPEPTTPELCARAEADLQQMRQENEMMLVQIRSMDAVVDQAMALLKQQIGTDSLTVAQVRALSPVRNDVRQ